MYYSEDGGTSISAMRYIYTESMNAEGAGFFLGVVVATLLENADTTELLSRMNDRQCFQVDVCTVTYGLLSIKANTVKSTTEPGKYDFLTIDIVPVAEQFPAIRQ